jgi:porin
MFNSSVMSLAAVGAAISVGVPVLAQDGQTGAGAPEKAVDAPAAKQSDGVLPLPEYGGDVWTRPFLLDGWGDTRTGLAEQGLQIDIDFVQTLQSVVDGGRDTGTRYGGSLDYVMTLDLMKMGLVPGAFVKFRAESRYGEFVNDIAGPILPVSIDGYFPLTDEPDENIPFTITDLAYFQYFSKEFAVFAGKFDTLDGDPNEFASGRGNTQFQNASFVFNPAITGLVPYSTLGWGVIWQPDANLTISSSMYNTADSSTTTGFDDFGDGWTWSTEINFQYSLSELPGGQNVGFVYAWDNEFIDLNGRFFFEPGEGLIAPTTDDATALYWSMWQYLYTEEEASGPLNLTNGTPDLQGVGVFARAGLADDDVLPFSWTFSVGLGGRGIIPDRDNDTFGIGYAYADMDSGRLLDALNVQSSTQSLEGFYSIAITPATLLSFDVQYLDAAPGNVDSSLVLGARLYVRF